MDLRIPWSSTGRTSDRWSLVPECICGSWLHFHLLYLRTILSPRTLSFRICILGLHVARISWAYSSLWDTPWNLLRQVWAVSTQAYGYGLASRVLLSSLHACNRIVSLVFFQYLFLAFRISLSCDISALALCDICNSSSYVINFSRLYGWTSFCFSMRLALPASNYSKRRFFFYRFNATALFFHKHSLWFSIWRKQPKILRF